MYFKSKKISLLILGLTSIACSRVMFLFFNDPEGPNLLVVMVMAAIVYFLSLLVYLFYPAALPFTGLKRLLLVIFIQVILVTCFYFWLNKGPNVTPAASQFGIGHSSPRDSVSNSSDLRGKNQETIITHSHLNILNKFFCKQFI